MKTIKLNLLFLFLLTHALLRAQTGPGGVGSSTNNIIWLDANFGVFSDAGITPAINTSNVQRWNDKSGNNNHANQTTVGTRPNYITNVSNGFPALGFTAANADLLGVLGVTTSNTASIWTVVSYSSLPSPNPGILQGSPTGQLSTTTTSDKKIGVWVNSGNTRVWGRGIQSDNTSQNISQITALTVSTTHCISTIFRTNRIDQYVNNAAAGNNTSHNGTLGSWTDVSIGSQGNESWNGNIFEVIVFNTVVNSAQRIIIDNYLAAKYGLTLSSNDTFNEDDVGNGNYDHDVAGIGRVDASNIHNDAQGTGIVRILSPTGLGNNEFLMWGHDNGEQEAFETTDVPAGVEARFDRVWRFSERNAANTADVSVGNINMRWDLSGLAPSTASDLRLLIDQDNDGLFNDETPISGAIDLGGDIFEFQNIAAGTGGTRNNKRFTLATIDVDQTPLPIKLVYFKAKPSKEGSVKLEWQTASEINNHFFTVERSLNVLDWETVSTKDGAGFSSSILNYSAVDSTPFSGLSYYRLKQTDYDGKFEYSAIEVVNLKTTRTNNIYIYPNPTNHSIAIQGNPEELSEIKVINGLGQDITNLISTSYSNSSSLLIDLSNLANGVYFVKTKTDSGIVLKR